MRSSGWDRSGSSRRGLANAGMGLLRLTLLFGSAAIAIALILTPIVAKHAEKLAYSDRPVVGVDHMSTGSISGGPNGSGTGYTIRRSVLQNDPSSVCVIRQNGSRSGNC